MESTLFAIKVLKKEFSYMCVGHIRFNSGFKLAQALVFINRQLLQCCNQLPVEVLMRIERRSNVGQYQEIDLSGMIKYQL